MSWAQTTQKAVTESAWYQWQRRLSSRFSRGTSQKSSSGVNHSQMQTQPESISSRENEDWTYSYRGRQCLLFSSQAWHWWYQNATKATARAAVSSSCSSILGSTSPSPATKKNPLSPPYVPGTCARTSDRVSSVSNEGGGGWQVSDKGSQSSRQEVWRWVGGDRELTESAIIKHQVLQSITIVLSLILIHRESEFITNIIASCPTLY